MSVNSYNSRIAKNTLFLYVRMLLVLFVSLYTTRVVLNVLGVVDFGINSVVAGFVSMFSFLNTSMSNGIQRFYNFKLGKEGEKSITQVFNMALLIQVALAIVIVLLLETVGIWYLNNKMIIPIERMETAQWLYQFSVCSLILVIMQIPYSASIMAHERMDYYAYVSIIEVILKLSFALYLPYVSFDKLLAYGGYGLGIALLNFFLYFIYSKRHFKELRLEFCFHNELFKDMLSFSGWNIFGTFSYMLKGQGLNVLLNVFFGPVVNAAKGVSSMIENAIQGFQSNIVISFRPQLVQSYAEGNYDRVNKLMFSLSKISYVLLFALSIPVIIELSYILHLWLGEAVPDYTISFTTLTLIIMVISGLNSPVSQVVHATGKMKRYQLWTSVCVCAILPISWIVLKLGSNPISVYWVSLALVIINQYVSLVLLKEVFDYSLSDYFKKVIIPCVVVSAVGFAMTIIPHIILEESFIRLIIVALVGVTSSFGTAYFMLNNEEKELIGGFMKKIFGSVKRKKERK